MMQRRLSQLCGLVYISASAFSVSVMGNEQLTSTRCTVTMIDRELSEWEKQLDQLSMAERQLLANYLYFLHFQARGVRMVQDHLGSLMQNSYQLYASLVHNQDGAEPRIALETSCKQLTPLQQELLICADALKQCEEYSKSCNGEQYSKYVEATNSLRSLGERLICVLSQDFDPRIVDLQKNTSAEVQRMIEFLQDAQNKINDVDATTIAEQRNSIVRIYTLRDVAGKCIDTFWNSVGLHLNTASLPCAFIELSAYIFGRGYKAVYATLDAEHKMLLTPLIESYKGILPDELPNPLTEAA
jgi:hypothetical protein